MPTPFEDAAARLVAKWSKASKHTTADVLTLGQLTHLAIRARLRGLVDRGARVTARADAVKDLRAALVEAGCDRATELQRWVACWAVGDVFGMEAARGLPLATLRAFIPLVRRDARHETWAARKTFRDFALQTWGNAATMKTREVAAVIREKVNGSRKPRTPKAQVNALQRVVKSIDALPEQAQRQLLRALHARFYPQAQQAAPAVAPAQRAADLVQAAPQVHVARIDAPAVAQPHLPAAVPEQERAGFFGSWGRKAG